MQNWVCGFVAHTGQKSLMCSNFRQQSSVDACYLALNIGEAVSANLMWIKAQLFSLIILCVSN